MDEKTTSARRATGGMRQIHFSGPVGPFIHALELMDAALEGETRQWRNWLRRWPLPVISAETGMAASRSLHQPDQRHHVFFRVRPKRFPVTGWSDILFLPQYRNRFNCGILLNMCDILGARRAAQHGLGTRWKRTASFYRTDEGIDKSLNELWGAKVFRLS